MNKIEQELENSIQPGQKYLLGVSGGADSMVMLYVANNVAKQKDAKIRVITVEHGIRGAESVADSKFVQDACKNLGIDCICTKIDAKKYAQQNKLSLEESARILRYQAFEEQKSPDEVIMVAHNKDDQAETVLMHIFRGSGIDGATGIKNRQNILRPLINITKKEILDYATIKKIAYVVDSTNNQTEYSRNYLRKEVLPKIEQIYPNVTENIVKFADFCSQAQQLIDDQIDSNWFQQQNNVVLLDHLAFSQNALVVAKAIKLAYNMLGEYSDLESKHIDIIKEFCLVSKEGSIINLPHGVIAEKRKNKVLFYKINSTLQTDCKFHLGENILPCGKIIVAKLVSSADVVFGEGKFYADYDKIPLEAVWRTKKEGDRFTKLGSHGSKKLSDYYTDKKLSHIERQNQLVLATNSTILYVENLDISDNIKIDAKTEKIVCLESK